MALPLLLIIKTWERCSRQGTRLIKSPLHLTTPTDATEEPDVYNVSFLFFLKSHSFREATSQTCLNLFLIFKGPFVVLLEDFFFFFLSSRQLPSNSSLCLQSLFWAPSHVTYITLFNCSWTGSNNLGNRSGPSQQIPSLRILMGDFPSPLPASYNAAR